TIFIRPGEIISTSPVVLKTLTGDSQIVFGTEKGKVFVYTPGTPVEKPVLISTIIKDTSFIIKKIAGDNSFISFIAEPTIESIPPSPIELYFDNSGNLYSFSGEVPIDLAVTKDKNGNYISIVLTNQNNFYIISANELLSSFKVETSYQINSFSLTDLRKDGNIYIVFNNGNKLEARNFEGALADNYPVIDPEGNNFVMTPLAMDFEGDDRSELIAFTEDGRIFAFDGPSGRLVDGFPISSGAKPTAVPILFSDNGKPSLAVIDENNSFSGWNIGSVDGKYYWSEKNGNNLNSAFIPGAESVSAITEFFPKNRAYNYPNPVYDGQTFIRYYVSEESKINIKIFDLAGGFVAELNDFASGGMDCETVWNVGNIQSGVYLARIEAVSNSGKSESQVIKIAIVK
ncbi:MAG: T9SS type A sorting domain-containing protein, partial [Ignavibacteriaceae bacterium]|nr:T9SS type A sorting domain-containing protein [Ignavibacteriaceae bacterium]